MYINFQTIDFYYKSRRGGDAGSAGSADPPILRTVGQAYVSDPPIFWMVIQFRRSILHDFSTNNYKSVKKNFVVLSHTHFAIIHCLTIHANFSRISAENCVAEYQPKKYTARPISAEKWSAVNVKKVWLTGRTVSTLEAHWRLTSVLPQLNSQMSWPRLFLGTPVLIGLGSEGLVHM